MKAAVVRATSDSSAFGASWEITVSRDYGDLRWASARDVPADIREALQDWLDSAKDPAPPRLIGHGFYSAAESRMTLWNFPSA